MPIRTAANTTEGQCPKVVLGPKVVLAAHAWLEQPASGAEVPAEVTTLTGITCEMVAGQRIDDAAVLELLADSNLVISHNASFDRPKLEARLPAFAVRPWACTATEIDWKAEGIGSAKLDYVAFRMGFIFAGAHRGEIDCLAGVEVLSRTLPVSGALAMSSLLARARLATSRVWAIGSPFDAKDALRRRGYRWSDGSIPGSARAWYRDVPATEAEAELEWLQAMVGCPCVSVRLTARDRHAGRVMLVP
jgi:DNA polymerase-3 subunit epsilon